LWLAGASTAGNAIIDFRTTTALPAAGSSPILLGGIMATVPGTAYYKAKDLLHFSSLSVNTGVTAVGTDALQLVTFLGDAAGSGAIVGADTLDIARVVAQADQGFAAYALTAPDLVGDILGDGSVDGPDGAALGRYISGIAVPQIPTYPGMPVNELSIAGPSAKSLSPLQLALGVSPRGSTPAATVTSGKPSPPLADELFAALARGPVDADESAVLGSIAGSVLGQASTAEASEAGSAQADLERFLWESGDSSWSDGDGQGLF
jgi:hypothetical protein